jgi:chemotaxis protein methyltransferase CheR
VELIPLSISEFKKFQSLLYTTVGINMTEAKLALVNGRLARRVQQVGLNNFDQYYKLITGDNARGELQVAIDLLTTNETYFFREPKHFDFLRDTIVPNYKSSQLMRIWCAASSSGEEPYTIGMTLAESLPNGNWELMASDISSRVLERAACGLYPMERAKDIPRHLLAKYCLKGIGSQEGSFIIDRQLKSKIQFCQINLNNSLPNTGMFDVIFMRNVLIYFDAQTKAAVVRRALDQLKVGGYFIVSHSENLHGITSSLNAVKPSVYIKS